MNKPAKDSFEYQQLQRISQIMIANATIIVDWAQKRGVTTAELMAYLETPEGYKAAIEFSTKVYSIGVEHNIFRPLNYPPA